MRPAASPGRRTWLLTLFWAEVILAAACAVLAVATAIHPDWIESLTGLDPDAGSGSAEWAVTLVLALVAVALAVCAAILLDVSFVEGGSLGVAVGVSFFALFGGLWFALPLWRRSGYFR